MRKKKKFVLKIITNLKKEKACEILITFTNYITRANTLRKNLS